MSSPVILRISNNLLKHKEIDRKCYVGKPDLENCTKSWVQINDNNFNTAINWYKSCSELAKNLSGFTREKYKVSLIENIKKSSDRFFPNSSLSLDLLARMEHQLGNIVHDLLFPTDFIETQLKVINNKKSKESKPVLQTAKDKKTMMQIYSVALICLILTLIIFTVMCLLCAQYKKMRERLRYGDREENVCFAAKCDCRRRRIWDTGEYKKSFCKKADDDSAECISLAEKCKGILRTE